VKCSVAALALTLTATTQQQGSLPSNYQTTFENADFLVMRVHYGPHEFVPMHDHTAYPTLYVYLNDSGPVKIIHEKPDNLILTRPPTHTGAFRLAPGAIERHSVQSLSDTPSDFLRIELKRIPLHDIKVAQHFAVPNPLMPGARAEFQDAALEVDRIVCSPDQDFPIPPSKQRSLLVAINNSGILTGAGEIKLNAGDVKWLEPNAGVGSYKLFRGGQFLRISLRYPG
jgi:hypothetical protein